MSTRDELRKDDPTVAVARLNQIAEPLGYVVVLTPATRSRAMRPTLQKFTVHRIDQPIDRGQTFNDAVAAHSHLVEIARWDLWALDLDSDSVQFDPESCTVTDVRTGETFSFGGRWWGREISGVNATTGERRAGEQGQGAGEQGQRAGEQGQRAGEQGQRAGEQGQAAGEQGARRLVFRSQDQPTIGTWVKVS